jgi:hypothetical protein
MTLPVRAFRAFVSTQNQEPNQRSIQMAVLSMAALLCLLPVHLSATAKTVAVASSGTACANATSVSATYTTIQAAVNAVTVFPGSTIKVCPGTYNEQVNITSKLTLEGVGPTVSVIYPPSGGLIQNGTDLYGDPIAAQIFVDANSASVTIENLTIDGTGNNVTGCGPITLTGIQFQNTAGTITKNVVQNQYQTDYVDFGGCQNGLAITVESTTISPTVTVSDNFVSAYQKGGITTFGNAPGTGGPNVSIEANRIVGLGATAMNWQAGGMAAGNGIQASLGAIGTISDNTVDDNIWGPDAFDDTGNAASGILVYASANITVSSNYVGSAQFGIVTDSDPVLGPADSANIKSNSISGTQIFDAIDVCSSSNMITSNTIYGSSESGIHFDDTCSSGSYNSGANNTAASNTINGGCAGVLLGTGSGNTISTASPDIYYNVANVTLAGDMCQATPKAASNSRRLRPSPYIPGRK